MNTPRREHDELLLQQLTAATRPADDDHLSAKNTSGETAELRDAWLALSALASASERELQREAPQPATAAIQARPPATPLWAQAAAGISLAAALALALGLFAWLGSGEGQIVDRGELNHPAGREPAVRENPLLAAKSRRDGAPQEVSGEELDPHAFAAFDPASWDDQFDDELTAAAEAIAELESSWRQRPTAASLLAAEMSDWEERFEEDSL